MSLIEHTMLVSEISREFPQCRPVFEKYGIAGCGGADGPPEPLFIFAAAHRVPLEELIDELNRAVRGEWKETPVTKPVEDLAAEQLYKQFVWASLVVALTLGFGLGLVNLLRIAAAESYAAVGGTLKQLHAHAQVMGWVGLYIMGVALHAVPRMKMRPLRSVRAARWCLGLIVGGLVMRATGARLAVVGSGLMEVVAVGLFLWLLVDVVAGSTQARETHEKFILASLVWLGVLAVGNVWLVWQRVPALGQALWVQAALFGFIANMIFGFSLRVLPHFLGLREAKTWAANVGFVAWNAAILCRYPLEKLAWVASCLEAIGAVLLVYALGIFAKRRVKIVVAGVDGTFAWFITLGYVWLLVNVALPFHADVYRLTPSARHTMAVGFILPVMFGVGYRVLPIFNGVNLWSGRLMRASFWMLAGGTTLAMSMALNKAYEGQRWTYVWSAVAGTLVLAAVVMFAVNLWQTLRTKAEKFVVGMPVRATTRVADLLEVYPALRPVLIHGGLAGLAAMRHGPPRFVTLEFAARRHGIDPEALIKTLNEEIERTQS